MDLLACAGSIRTPRRVRTEADAPAAKDLHHLMRDPRHRRDRDPGVIAPVTAGFRRLNPALVLTL